jgi:hypothetical protein
MTDRDNILLSKYMSMCDVPCMVLCDSNQEAREFYDAGCTYVVQQDFLAAKEMVCVCMHAPTRLRVM